MSRMMKLLPLAFMMCLYCVISTTLAQNEPGEMSSSNSSVAADTGSSFAQAFFVSRKTDPLTGETSLELLGSLIIWFLLLLSTLSIGGIGYLSLTNQRKNILPMGVLDEIKRLLDQGEYKQVIDLTAQENSFFSRILQFGLQEAPRGYAAVIRRLHQSAEELTMHRFRRVEYLNVLGQVSPMIGLFGTVYGMILAFRAIVISGGNPDPVLLAGGIGTALTTTFWGLIVAIPALAGYTVIRNRIDALTAEATIEAEILLNQFKPPQPTEKTTKEKQ